MAKVKTFIWTAERNKKISDSRKGMKFSDEHRKKLSLAHRGNKSALGHKLTDEQKKNCGKSNIGRKHTDEHRRKNSDAHKGKKSYLWKGGITKRSIAIRYSLEYKLWRRSVFERDNFACIFCGFKSKGVKPSDIQADHIKPFAYYPELRFAIDNGRTLCVPCHKKTNTYMKNNIK